VVDVVKCSTAMLQVVSEQECCSVVAEVCLTCLVLPADQHNELQDRAAAISNIATATAHIDGLTVIKTSVGNSESNLLWITKAVAMFLQSQARFDHWGVCNACMHMYYISIRT
jgi:hypothetical protein